MSFKFVINKPRRSHISCSECREKKLKCDEAKPTCSRCFKHNKTCSYLKPNKKPTHGLISKRRGRQKGHEKLMSSSLISKNSFIESSSSNIEESKLIEIQNDKEIATISPNIDHKIIETRYNNSNLDELVGIQSIYNFHNDHVELFYPIDDLLFTPGLSLANDYAALSILSNSQNLEIYFKRYNDCYSLILPLAFKSRVVMYTFAGWLLSLTNNSESESFLLESLKLCDELEANILKGDYTLEDLSSLFVSLTCHGFICSDQGSYTAWRKVFEKLYNIFEVIDIKYLINDTTFDKYISWFLIWFCYQDMLRVGKILSLKTNGPVFPLNLYKTLVSKASYEQTHQHSQEIGTHAIVGPVTVHCFDLFLILAEINNLHDQLILKWKNIRSCYILNIKPILDLQNKQGLFNFMNTETYKNYFDMKLKFQNWMISKAESINSKLAINELGLNNQEQEYIAIYRVILKGSLRLYLRLKVPDSIMSPLETWILSLNLLTNINRIIDWDKNSCLLFPFLVVGLSINSDSKHDKLLVEKIYLNLQNYMHRGNMAKIWKKIQDCWNRNKDDDNTFHGVDDDGMIRWDKFINSLDCDLCVF